MGKELKPIIAPARGLPFVDEGGIPVPRMVQWLEGVTQKVQTGQSTTTTTNYTLTALDEGVNSDTTDGDLTITLPDAKLLKGHTFYVQAIGSANTTTVNSSGLIGGVTSITIPSSLPFPCPHFKSDGSAWMILGYI